MDLGFATAVCGEDWYGCTEEPAGCSGVKYDGTHRNGIADGSEDTAICVEDGTVAGFEVLLGNRLAGEEVAEGGTDITDVHVVYRDRVWNDVDEPVEVSGSKEGRGRGRSRSHTPGYSQMLGRQWLRWHRAHTWLGYLGYREVESRPRHRFNDKRRKIDESLHWQR